MKTYYILSIAVLLSLNVKAQTKIGNITLSDSEAKAYFLDCYNRPDTIPTKSQNDFSCTNCSRPMAEFDRAKKIEQVPAGSYKEERGYLIPRKPSEIDFIRWKAKNASN